MIAAQAVELLDTDQPQKAIDFAESVSCEHGHEELHNRLRAYVLTHGGERLADRGLIERGLGLWKELEEDGRGDRAYNVANAEMGLFEFSVRDTGYIKAMLNTHDLLHSARSLQEQVGRNPDAPTNLRIQALTNCGNAYDSVARNVEAIDRYSEAIDLDPRFGMALGNRAIAFAHYAGHAHGHAPAMLHQAARDLDAALEDKNRVLQIGGPRSLRHFTEVRANLNIDKPADPWGSSADDWTDPYLRWCFEERTFLSPSLSCLRPDDTLLDPLFPRRFSMGPGGEEFRRADNLIDAFNALKQDFVSARYLTWLGVARDGPIEEQAAQMTGATGFHDSLLSARWGIRTGLAIQAFTGVTNLLDKIASFVHLYFKSERGRRVYFRGFWRGKKPKGSETAVLEPSLADELAIGNTGLLALWDLAYDLEAEESLLAQLLQLRHAATHRFLVAHHKDPPPSNELLERVDWREFVGASLEQLRVARAALVYLVRLVDSREARILESEKSDGKGRPELPIPLVDPLLTEMDFRE